MDSSVPCWPFRTPREEDQETTKRKKKNQKDHVFILWEGAT